MPSVDVVWSPATRDHVAGGEVWVGVRIEGTETAERVDTIVEELTRRGHRLVEASQHDDAALARVHDPTMVTHLRGVFDEWTASGIVEESGQDRVVPYVFPTPAMLGRIPATRASAVHARAGVFGYDTTTFLSAGTWSAARAAVDCALSAVDRVDAGAPAAYALCRPPGHHATTSGFGGSCYLNNAAVAAQALLDRGHGRVAVVDVDAHHGNGSSEIFYERGEVFYGSIHVDPAAGWFPHFVGHASERGAGAGEDANLNLPLTPGAGDAEFVSGVGVLADAVARHGATALVVSLGVDAAADDPESPLQVTTDGYGRAGEVLAALQLPTVLVQEGGYHLPSLGGLVAAHLAAYA